MAIMLAKTYAAFKSAGAPEEDAAAAAEELADYEKVKRIALLPDEFTIESGELTPTLKVKRRVIEQKYGNVIESLYDGEIEKAAEKPATETVGRA